MLASSLIKWAFYYARISGVFFLPRFCCLCCLANDLLSVFSCQGSVVCVILPRICCLCYLAKDLFCTFSCQGSVVCVLLPRICCLCCLAKDLLSVFSCQGSVLCVILPRIYFVCYLAKDLLSVLSCQGSVVCVILPRICCLCYLANDLLSVCRLPVSLRRAEPVVPATIASQHCLQVIVPHLHPASSLTCHLGNRFFSSDVCRWCRSCLLTVLESSANTRCSVPMLVLCAFCCLCDDFMLAVCVCVGFHLGR